MTDYWSKESGYIFEGSIVVPAYSDAAITEGYPVKFSNTADGYYRVATCAAVGDSIGIALRAATAAGDFIPVALSGIVKVLAGNTIALQDMVMAGLTVGCIVSIIGVESTTTAGGRQVGGTRFIMGWALQAAGTTGDYITIMLNPIG